jgi:hypothetical protein
LLAYRYYARERKLFRAYEEYYFETELDVRKAVDYVCRTWGVHRAEVIILDTDERTRFGGWYRPQTWLLNMKSGVLGFYPDQLDFRTVAHELAHHVDAEEKVLTYKWARGWPRKNHRAHRNRHMELMAWILAQLTAGSREVRGARPRAAVKVRT